MLIPTLEKLISFKTLSHDHKENRDALDWVQNELHGLPLYHERFSVNGSPSLVITTQQTKSPAIWFNAHIDVVGGSESVFEMQHKEGRVYGRGAYDMKFAIACYIELLKELGNKLPEYSIGVMITSDEEVGGFHGTKILLEKGYTGEACVIPDGGFNWCFEEAAKGVLQFIVRSYGTSAHSSRPWEGDNSIESLTRFMQDLRQKFPEEPCEDEDHLHNTLSFTTIKSGENNNKIPNYAEALADVRFMPDISKEDIYNIVESVKKDFPKIQIDEYFYANGFSNDVNNPYFVSLRKSAEDLFNIKTSLCLSHGSSDARYYAAKGITPLVVAPNGGGHHGEHEWIDIEDLNRFYDVLKDFVQKEAR